MSLLALGWVVGVSSIPAVVAYLMWRAECDDHDRTRKRLHALQDKMLER